MKKFINFLKENKENNFIEELKNLLNNETFYNAVQNLNFGDRLENLSGFDIDPDTESILWKIDENEIDDILGIDKGILRYINSIDDYGFEMHVDNEEKNYIGNHMNEKTINLIKQFAKELNYELIIDDNFYVYKFLDDIGLDDILTDYISNLSYIKEKAMSKLKKDIFDKNEVFYYDSYEKTFNVNIEELYKYIKNEKDIKTLEDALISICIDFPYSYNIEYSELYDYLDYKELPNIIEKSILDYYNEYIKDEYWLEIIRTNNIDVFKKYYKLNDWSQPLSLYYKYKLIFTIDELNPSEYNFSAKIYDFVYSKEFFNNIKDDFKDDLETYNKYFTKMKSMVYSKFNL
jgi:hypothetical protein